MPIETATELTSGLGVPPGTGLGTDAAKLAAPPSVPVQVKVARPFASVTAEEEVQAAGPVTARVTVIPATWISRTYSTLIVKGTPTVTFELEEATSMFALGTVLLPDWEPSALVVPLGQASTAASQPVAAGWLAATSCCSTTGATAPFVR